MKQIAVAVTTLMLLAACEGGVLKKKNCQTCETLTYDKTGEISQNRQQVCGKDEVPAFIVANTISTSSLTVVITCK
jgi:hypothetical protein